MNTTPPQTYLGTQLDLLAKHHELIAERLEAGATYKEIVEALAPHVPGVGSALLSRYVRLKKLPLRRRGLPTGRRRVNTPEIQSRNEFIIDQYRAGSTLEEIAGKVGLTKEAIRQIVGQANLPSVRQVIAMERLEMAKLAIKPLKAGEPYHEVAQILTKRLKRQVRPRDVIALCTTAVSRYYETLRFPARKQPWGFMSELLTTMEQVREAMKSRSPRVVAVGQTGERRRATIVRVVRASRLPIEEIAQRSGLSVATINRLLQRPGVTRQQWGQLRGALDDLPDYRSE